MFSNFSLAETECSCLTCYTDGLTCLDASKECLRLGIEVSGVCGSLAVSLGCRRWVNRFCTVTIVGSQAVVIALLQVVARSGTGDAVGLKQIGSTVGWVVLERLAAVLAALSKIAFLEHEGSHNVGILGFLGIVGLKTDSFIEILDSSVKVVLLQEFGCLTDSGLWSFVDLISIVGCHIVDVGLVALNVVEDS